MEQFALSFEPVRSRKRDPETSARAGRNARQFAAGHMAMILEALTLGPATFREIADRCGMERHAVARRLPELRDAGRVIRTDIERDGCAVWMLA